jgi:preprotein translocase subunit SecE
VAEGKGTAETGDVPEERLARAKAGGTSDGTVGTPAKRGTKRDVAERRGNPFARLVRFFREVVAELRKVIWPTRKELITYTAVVVVFVAIMVSIVALLDVAFAKAVLFVFGNKNAAAAG